MMLSVSLYFRGNSRLTRFSQNLPSLIKQYKIQKYISNFTSCLQQFNILNFYALFPRYYSNSAMNSYHMFDLIIMAAFNEIIRKMLQRERQTDFSLDELIDIVNPRNNPLKPITANANSHIKKISYSVTAEKQQQFASKTLQFKPWSGIDLEQTDIIKEEIQGQANQIKEENQEQECDREEGPIKTMDNASTITNMAKHNEIGYFYKFQNNPIKLIKKLLDENGFKYANTNKNWSIYWSSSVIKMETYHALLPYQKINHFPNSFHLTRKDLMNKCISKMQIKYGFSNFNFLPKTYILPQQMPILMEQMNRNGGLTYIVKPHNRSQGKGITVTSNLNVILGKLQKYSSLIVSHYIYNPLLINGLKFDLRIYVAITGVNPLRIYVYEEGLARFATELYDQTYTDCQNKQFQHLTNYSVNKKNAEFIKSQNENDDYYGSKWSLTALKDFLSFNIGKSETSELFQRVDDVIVKTIISGENILFSSFVSNVPYNNSCFQVLGFDIMIDSNLKPWLIEVNMSPSMNSDSPIDIKIKGNMIADLLTMTGITPLDDRYLDGGQVKNQIKNFMKPDNKTVEIGPIERYVLKEVRAEYDRKGSWRRVFPCIDKKYKQFFDIDRYFNKVVREDEGIQRQYASLNNKFEKRTSHNVPIRMDKQAYNSVNQRKRTAQTRQKPGFSIRIQHKKMLKKTFL